MMGRELLETMDIPVGQYRLSVKLAEGPERIGRPINFSVDSIEYQYVLKRNESDSALVFPLYCEPGLKPLETENFSIAAGGGSSFHQLLDFLNMSICDALDESLFDFDKFCDELGYDAEVENDYGDIVRNDKAFDIWEKLNAFRDATQDLLPFEALRNAMYYGVRGSDGERLVLPEKSSLNDAHVSFLLQTMLDEVEYVDQNGKSHSVKMAELNPAIEEWLTSELVVEQEIEAASIEC